MKFADFIYRQNNALTLQKGKKFLEYLKPSGVPKIKSFLKKAQKGEASKFELLANPDSENAFWSRFTISPAYNSKKVLIGIACIGYNIDIEKRQQEKIENQFFILTKIAKMHSHEIRHPLTNILAIINMLKQENFAMTKQYLEFLEISANELVEVIRKVVMESYSAA